MHAEGLMLTWPAVAFGVSVAQSRDCICMLRRVAFARHALRVCLGRAHNYEYTGFLLPSQQNQAAKQGCRDILYSKL